MEPEGRGGERRGERKRGEVRGVEKIRVEQRREVGLQVT